MDQLQRKTAEFETTNTASKLTSQKNILEYIGVKIYIFSWSLTKSIFILHGFTFWTRFWVESTFSFL